VSFSFYLLHQPILVLVSSRVPRLIGQPHLHPGLVLIACLFSYPLVLLLSYLLYCWVEKPCITLGRGLWNKLRFSRLAAPTP
jgi:peptidoglycan/LPS O-acetylase OafA/YrhL